MFDVIILCWNKSESSKQQKEKKERQQIGILIYRFSKAEERELFCRKRYIFFSRSESKSALALNLQCVVLRQDGAARSRGWK